MPVVPWDAEDLGLVPAEDHLHEGPCGVVVGADLGVAPGDEEVVHLPPEVAVPRPHHAWERDGEVCLQDLVAPSSWAQSARMSSWKSPSRPRGAPALRASPPAGPAPSRPSASLAPPRQVLRDEVLKGFPAVVREAEELPGPRGVQAGVPRPPRRPVPHVRGPGGLDEVLGRARRCGRRVVRGEPLFSCCF